MITEPVGARLARESVDAVCRTDRVIVLREQARLPQVITEPVGAVLARDADNAVQQMYRVIVHREQARILQGGLLILPFIRMYPSM